MLATLAGCSSSNSGGTPTPDSSGSGSGSSGGQASFAVETTSTGNPYADTKKAAGHVEGSAKVLAGGIATGADLGGDASSEAAGLRATLTGLLQEHVYLAGYAVDAAYSFGPDSKEFDLAAKSLDENTVELADVIGNAAGSDNREAFISLWRDHIGFFVDYALAAAEDDDEGRQAALDDLDGYTNAAGEFFEDISGGELPAGAVTENLDAHIDTLSAAIDAFAAGEASAFDDLKAAGDHVVGSAGVLSSGLAAALDLNGDTESEAAGLRVGLTAGLQEHVYLAGITVKTGYAAGLDSGAFEAAAGTLDTNSVELADAIGQLAGEENRDAFLSLWRDHIGFFVDYAAATAGDDRQGQAEAIENLDGYTNAAGGFFEDISGGELPADAIAKNLRKHIATLGGAIDSLDAAINQ
ncbi:hypothetical protein [Haloglomus litoreum]|uniref:hypothetical protein n=1 Tax=Haloglomus litoreum TaxID=3034026 RepID=UPI0023E87012|nr:hypothetical protein [Haloglomus sp. DT116]